MSADLLRLGAVIRQRRAELGLTQVQVTDRGGPSVAVQVRLERGEATSVFPSTLAKIDKALDWHEGSAARTLAGGDARPQDEQLYTKAELDAHVDRQARLVAALEDAGVESVFGARGGMVTTANGDTAFTGEAIEELIQVLGELSERDRTKRSGRRRRGK